MTLQTAIVGFQRQTDNFTLSGGQWSAQYPIENCQNDEYARVARSDSAQDGDTVIIGNSDFIRPLRMFGIAAHNMTLDAAFRLRLYDNTSSPSVLVYDSGIQLVWPAAYTYQGRQWDTYNFWTGQYSDAEIVGQIPFRPILLDADYLADGWILELFDESNPSNYVDIGLLEATSGWQLSVNPEIGANYGYKFYTQTTELPGGLRRHDVYPPSYVFQGSIPYMDRQEVQNNAMELWRQYGTHRCFMWMPHPDNPELWLRNSKMVNLVEPGLFGYAISNENGEDSDSMPLNLEEYKG